MRRDAKVLERVAQQPLVTLARVKEYLGLTGTVADATLDKLIVAVSREVRTYLGRDLALQTYQDTFRMQGNGAAELSLSLTGIVSIVSVVEDSRELEDFEYEVDQEVGLLMRLYDGEMEGWSARKVTVTYTAGYVLPGETGSNLPEDIEQAVLLLVATAYGSIGQDPKLRRIEVDGVGSFDYGFGTRAGERFPPEIADKLLPYRRMV